MKTTLFHLTTLKQGFGAVAVMLIIMAGCNNVDTPKEDKDTTKFKKEIDWQNAGSEKIVRDEPKLAADLATQTMKLAQLKGYAAGEARAREILGLAYYNQSNYDSALGFFNQNLTVYQQLKDTMSWMGTLVDIGMVLDDQGKYESATKNYFEALRYYEKMGAKVEIAKIHNLLGLIFVNQANYSEALDHFRKDSVILYELLKIEPGNFSHKRNLVVAIGNLGLAFGKQERYQEALNYYLHALQIAEEINSQKDIALYSSNIGFLYKVLSNYPKAIDFLKKSLEVNRTIGNKRQEVLSLWNLGALYLDKKDFQNALLNLHQAEIVAKEIGDKNLLVSIFSDISSAYNSTDSCEKSLQYSRLYSNLKDSLLNEESSKQVAEMTIKHNVEVIKKDSELQKEKIEKQKTFLFSLSGVALLVISLAVVLFRANRSKKKANALLSRQNTEIEKQRDEIEKQKNLVEHQKNEITDSINYAKRIQQAILRPKEELQNVCVENFILFQPKDIVSGDFYWFHKTETELLIAACDCTGHGVPGAFMSMVGAEKFNEAVKHTLNPSEILQFLNRSIKVALHQNADTDSTRDGMDVALCRVEKTPNGIKVTYAGANRPLWILKKSEAGIEVDEIKATKKAIGGFTEDDQVYEERTLELSHGESFYIFSDGFADQFGGDRGKKMTTKRFKEALLAIQERTMAEQESILSKFFNEWKGSVEQTDDVLVIGLKA